MKFVVHTQTLENYGAHAESGKFADGMAYWKFKSGDTYVVSGLDRLQDAVAFVAAISMENYIGWKEFPCHYTTYDEWMAELAYDHWGDSFRGQFFHCAAKQPLHDRHQRSHCRILRV